MKRFVLLALIFAGCSQTEMEDPGPDITLVDPVINISNFESMMVEGDMAQFEVQLKDDMGMIDNITPVAWSSSDVEVLTVSSSGLVTALGGGQANIIATALGVRDEIAVTVEAAVIPTRSGSLMGTSGYIISGNFTLGRDEADDLILKVEGYTPDSNAPGPYFYLSNEIETITNAIKLGEAERDGAYEYNITAINDTVMLSSFNYLLVWCDPFAVTLGYGEFGE